jgi:hypothetical protein
MDSNKTEIKERSLLQLFLLLNVGLALAFVIYLFISHSGHPQVVSTSFPPASTKTNSFTNLLSAAGARTNAPKTNAVAISVSSTNPPPVAVPDAPPTLTLSKKKFTWQDVDSAPYLGYIESLRAVGCPDDKIHQIILADINELFDKKRVKEAVENDTQWWKSETDLLRMNVLQEKGRALEEERHQLIAKLLGAEAAENEKSEALLWSSVQLTGPVLGSLPADKHNQVQEICAKSLERQQSAFWARMNDGQAMNQIEMAKLREQTRTDLRAVLAPEEMEEFLLRYSHNAHQLRLELRGLDPTPDEFRKIFRSIDALDHQVQLEYGGVETMSQQQRERYERQRDTAIRETLAPGRHQAFLMTKDPLYRQAQMYAMQYNASPKAVMPLYRMTQVTESKRQQILNNAALNPQQKSEALNAVNIEQQQSIQKIIIESAAQR